MQYMGNNFLCRRINFLCNVYEIIFCADIFYFCPIMHCAPVRNENRAHAYVKRGKRMSDESLRRISAIARNAIQEIDCIANRLTNNSSSVTTSGLPAARTNSAGRGQNQNAFVELTRRFPTLSRASASGCAAQGFGRRSRGTAGVGQPSLKSEIRDLTTVGYQVEKMPLGRHDRLQLEQRGRVITAFTIEKNWDENQLYNKVKAQFPEDCKNLDFEFVKNLSGALVKPNLATGVKRSPKILLKSFATATTVYVRLLADDFSDEEDNEELTSSFNSFFCSQCQWQQQK